MRKTVAVSDVVDYCNGYLAAHGGERAARQGVIQVLEMVLGSADQYNGYRHLTNQELPSSELPGVRYNAEGILDYPQRFENTDPTRRQYSMRRG